eukprot:248605_1
MTAELHDYACHESTRTEVNTMRLVRCLGESLKTEYQFESLYMVYTFIALLHIAGLVFITVRTNEPGKRSHFTSDMSPFVLSSSVFIVLLRVMVIVWMSKCFVLCSGECEYNPRSITRQRLFAMSMLGYVVNAAMWLSTLYVFNIQQSVINLNALLILSDAVGYFLCCIRHWVLYYKEMECVRIFCSKQDEQSKLINVSEYEEDQLLKTI